MRSASLAHYRVVSTHVPQPKSVAENHHIIAPGSEVVVGNGAPQFGGYAKQREEVGGNLIALDPLRQILAGEINAPPAYSGKYFESFGLLLKVTEIGRGHRHVMLVLLRHGFPNRHGAVEVSEWKWAKQHGIDDAVHGGVSANAQGLRNDRHRSKARALHQHSNAILEVLKQGRHESFSDNCRFSIEELSAGHYSVFSIPQTACEFLVDG